LVDFPTFHPHLLDISVVQFEALLRETSSWSREQVFARAAPDAVKVPLRTATYS
jgi:hypothetical protein